MGNLRTGALISIILFGLSGCATVVRGTTDTLSITTLPAGAQALTSVKHSGKSSDSSPNINGFYGCEPTPCKIELPRRTNAIVTISLSGHQEIAYRIISSQTTSNDVLRPGLLIAGVPPGSHIFVGEPRPGSQIGLNSLSIFTDVATYGAGIIIDETSGANLNLVPQSVTAVLAPISDRKEGDNDE